MRAPVLFFLAAAALLAAGTASSGHRESGGPPLAVGFDYPVGDPDGNGAYVDPSTGTRHEGWYVATSFGERYDLGLHPGEDWNGRGGGNTDLGQPVFAIGAGRVVEAAEFGGGWGRIVVIEHRFRERGADRTVRSLYAHLSRIDVGAGDLVTRRQRIGAIGRGPANAWLAHLHLEIRTDLELAPDYWPSSHGDDLTAIGRRYLAPRAFIAAHR